MANVNRIKARFRSNADLHTILDSNFTTKELEQLWWTFSGYKLENPIKKQWVIVQVAQLLSFDDAEAFTMFLDCLPELLKHMIISGCHFDIIDASYYEKKYNVKILDKDNRYKFTLSNAQRIHCFRNEGGTYLRLGTPFKEIFSRFLEVPAHFMPKSLDNPGQQIWSNADSFSDNLPLLIEKMEPGKNSWAREALMRKGLLKGEIKTLRLRCGLPAFPSTIKKGVDPIELFTRYLYAFYEEAPQRAKQFDEWVQSSLALFFLEAPKPKNAQGITDGLKGATFENIILSDFLSSFYGSSLGGDFPDPPSRSTFKKILNELAQDGRWQSVDEILTYAEARSLDRSFVSWTFESQYLYIRADYLYCEGYKFSSDYDARIGVSGLLHRMLVYGPLFKAYFYLMAVLGIVDIMEQEIPLLLEKNGKKLPISPYDALSHVRITEFGKWCLGLRKEKPVVIQSEFEAIADSKLLLVTFKGKSLERKLFLEEIAVPLGDERYRVTEQSFIRSCTTKQDIEDCITRFKRLIEKDPQPHWEMFFTKIRNRSIFYETAEDYVLFKIPKNDEALRDIFTSNPKITKIAKRVEGGQIAVSRANMSKLIALMAEYGVLPPRN